MKLRDLQTAANLYRQRRQENDRQTDDLMHGYVDLSAKSEFSLSLDDGKSRSNKGRLSILFLDFNESFPKPNNNFTRRI